MNQIDIRWLKKVSFIQRETVLYLTYFCIRDRMNTLQVTQQRNEESSLPTKQATKNIANFIFDRDKEHK